MSDVADFSLLNDDEKAELERVRLAVVEGERNAGGTRGAVHRSG
jgi:hypothetical protein